MKLSSSGPWINLRGESWSLPCRKGKGNNVSNHSRPLARLCRSPRRSFSSAPSQLSGAPRVWGWVRLGQLGGVGWERPRSRRPGSAGHIVTTGEQAIGHILRRSSRIHVFFGCPLVAFLQLESPIPWVCCMQTEEGDSRTTGTGVAGYDVRCRDQVSASERRMPDFLGQQRRCAASPYHQGWPHDGELDDARCCTLHERVGSKTQFVASGQAVWHFWSRHREQKAGETMVAFPGSLVRPSN